MDFSADSLLLSLVVGTIGLGLFRYGKEHERPPQLFGGIAMMAYPMFVTGAGTMLAVATAIIGAIAIAVNAGY